MTAALVSGAAALTSGQTAKQPTVRAELKVKRYFLP
jgi:hypothetical protein